LRPHWVVAYNQLELANESKGSIGFDIINPITKYTISY